MDNKIWNYYYINRKTTTNDEIIKLQKDRNQSIFTLNSYKYFN